jgi:membrane protease YdiL (CAAX protease family)
MGISVLGPNSFLSSLPSVKSYRSEAASALSQDCDSPSCLTLRQWSLAGNHNSKQAACPIPDSSGCFGIGSKATGIGKIFYDYIIYPIEVGSIAGAMDFAFCAVLVAVEQLCSSFGIELVNEVEREPFDAFDAMLTCSLVPIVEEVLFRVVIQGSVKWVAAKILPNREIDILGYAKLPLPALVSLVATSILFGALHYSNGGMLIVFCATVAGINFGLLKEKVGLVSSCASHMVTNSLITSAEVLLGD